MKTHHLVALVIAAIAGLVIFLFIGTSSSPKKAGSVVSLGTPTAAAACPQGEKDCMPAATFVDTEGTTYTTDSLKGKVVVVNFWATWCGPCKKEIPTLSHAYDQYKAQGVVVLGIVTDHPDAQTMLNFASDHEMTYPVVQPTKDLMLAYNYPDQIPATWIYDRTGHQVYSTLGAISPGELDRVLASAVAH